MVNSFQVVTELNKTMILKLTKSDLSKSWKFLQTQTFFLNLRTSAIERTNSSLFNVRFRPSKSSSLPVVSERLGNMLFNFSLTKSEVGSPKSSFLRSSSSGNPRMIVLGFIAPIPEIRTSCWIPSRIVLATVISTKAFTWSQVQSNVKAIRSNLCTTTSLGTLNLWPL